MKEVATWKVVQKDLQSVISPSDSIFHCVSGSKRKSSCLLLAVPSIEVQNAMERVELETELAAVDAKVRVLQSFDTEYMESKLIHQKCLSHRRPHE